MSKTPLRLSVPSVIVALSGVIAIVLAAGFVYVNFIAQNS